MIKGEVMAGKCLFIATLLWLGLLPNAPAAETVTYSYDALNRLVRATYGSGSVIEYVYDSVGNRLVKNAYPTGAPNTPPAPASNPSPANGATGVAGSPLSLSWSGNDPGDVLSYFVYGGLTPTPSTLIWSGSQSSFAPFGIPASTIYYWKVVSRDSRNVETAGPVWSFTSGPSPVNGPPVVLSVSLSGTGTGTVTSNTTPSINCTGAPTDACIVDLTPNTVALLTAVPANDSRVKGWSQPACATSTACPVTMATDQDVAVQFELVPPVRMLIPSVPMYPGIEYVTLTEAFGMAQFFPYQIAIKSLARTFNENLAINAGTNRVTWAGGFRGDFSAVTGKTGVKGTVKVQAGTVVMKDIVIQAP